ncbi:MAG: DNA (cytosine-5-)-methyltransferase [Cardiobacteriaceae bacterium]|nr:DNA (cytosine-5-)-methyltransferase [Cardiobacteriaceae bacterium]
MIDQDDVTKIDVSKVPPHDIICAGFPCQPFSLAGKKKGAECPKSGRLIDHVIRIAKYHSPKFIFLENVPNILTIADGTFWDYLVESFVRIGYKIHHKIISPVDIGIPQNRKRIFVVAVRKDLDTGNFPWPVLTGLDTKGLPDVLENTAGSKPLESPKATLLKHWQELLDSLPITKLGSISIVAPEFGATYPFDFEKLELREIKRYKGAYGQDLSVCHSWDEVLAKMPGYCRNNKKVPAWIAKSVEFSRQLFADNIEICTCWSRKIEKKNNSWQILEWRGEHNNLNIYHHIVQFRASGIRILRPKVAPSLISMTPTQIPVIPSMNRYLSAYEAAKLQNLHHLGKLPGNPVRAFKALGNAVNALIVEKVSEKLHTYNV